MRNLWKKWWGKLIVIAVIVAIGAGAYYAGSKYLKRSSGSQTASNLTTAVAEKSEITVNVNGSGTIKPNSETDVNIEASGTIKKVYYKKGDTVKKGALMYEIENKDLPLAIKEAEVNIKQMQTSANNLKKQIANATVTAPASGMITLAVSSGDQAAATMPIAVIQDISKLTLTASIPVDQAINVQSGQSAQVTASGVSGSFTGTVSQVSAYTQNGQIGVGVMIAVPNSGNKLRPGETASAIIKTDSGNVTVSGQLVSQSTPVQVKAPISGEVQTVYVKDNSVVSKGQKILKFDTTDLQNSLDLQNVKIQQAQVSLADQKDQLAKLKVYAPVSGVIVEQYVEEGDDTGSIQASSLAQQTSAATPSIAGISGITSAAGISSATGIAGGAGSSISVPQTQTQGVVAAVIADSANYEVVIPVDELDINKIKVGQKAVITADALPDKEFSGKVTDISDEGTSQSGVATFDVTVTFPKVEGMKPGMTADAEIIAEQKENVLVVPIEAVVEKDGKKYVMVYDESSTSSSNKQTVASTMREVKTGINNESYIEIVNGLKEGEKVILQGVRNALNNPLSQMQGNQNNSNSGNPFGSMEQQNNGQ